MEMCSYSERLLPALLDGELSGPLRRKVASHMADCAVCTREAASIEQVQELVRNSLDHAVERVDFSAFLDGVMDQLDTSLAATPFWTVRFQLWRESWRFHRRDWLPEWTGSTVWTGLVGATATIALLLSILSLLPLSYTDTLGQSVSAPKQTQTLEEPAVFASALASAMDNQAQIESLTATTTVFLWNEPIGNATVIWVGDSGEMP